MFHNSLTSNIYPRQMHIYFLFPHFRYMKKKVRYFKFSEKLSHFYIRVILKAKLKNQHERYSDIVKDDTAYGTDKSEVRKKCIIRSLLTRHFNVFSRWFIGRHLTTTFTLSIGNFLQLN